MKQLLERFNDVTTNFDILSEEDKVVLESLTVAYESALNALNCIYDTINTSIEMQTKSLKNTKHVGLFFDDYDYSEVNYKYSMRKIKEKYFFSILEHFSLTYQVDFADIKKYFVKKITNDEYFDVSLYTILDNIQSSLSGMSLVDRAVEDIRYSIKEFIENNRFHELSICKRKISISNVCYNGNGDIYIADYMFCLISAIFNFNGMHICNYKYASTLQSSLSNKDVYVKTYKNGKLDICFKSEKIMKEFCEKYQIIETNVD